METGNKVLDNFLKEAKKRSDRYNREEAKNRIETPFPEDIDIKQTAALLENTNKITDIELKEKYGKTILNILVGWVIFVGFLLIMHCGPIYIPLSETILITLLTTTTANVIALPTIILNYLFPNNNKQKQ